MACKRCNDTGDQRYWEGRWRDEKAENERLRAALEPFVRGLTMFETGDCVTRGLPVPRDDEPAKHVYVGDQRRARTALNQQTTNDDDLPTANDVRGILAPER
jgi:hypothetical protein